MHTGRTAFISFSLAASNYAGIQTLRTDSLPTQARFRSEGHQRFHFNVCSGSDAQDSLQGYLTHQMEPPYFPVSRGIRRLLPRRRHPVPPKFMRSLVRFTTEGEIVKKPAEAGQSCVSHQSDWANCGLAFLTQIKQGAAEVCSNDRV